MSNQSPHDSSPADPDATVVTNRASDDDVTVVMNRAADDDATVVLKADDDATVVTANIREVEPDELKPGDTLNNRFVIDRVLGRGGMGVVYRAQDLRKVEAKDRDPYVALKALSHVFQTDENMVVALQREARKAQTLAHPGIATVFDFDRDGNLVYLTMEQLSGSPLDDFLEEHPEGLPRERALPIIRGLSLALAYAHNNHIVHSDFKPGNVFLDENDRPKVLDFGIARATPMDESDIEAGAQTVFDAGELGALTPSYASVEMFHGADPHPADDVYALAIVSYELLTGRHPFDKKPAIQAQAQGLVPEPIPGLKRREWRAILKGLEFDRSQRADHASEFLRGFEVPTRTRLVTGIAAAMAITLVGYAGFVQFQEAERIAPDVPFEELSAEVQADFRDKFDTGVQLEGFGEINTALDQYWQAYQVHPRNPEATERLISAWEGYEQMVSTPEMRDNAISNLAVMMQDDFLGKHEQLLELKERLAR